VYIVASMGHIYMGTIGTPGAYTAMRHGTVDEQWAAAHHELWYHQVKGGNVPPAGVPGSPGTPGPDHLPPGTRPGSAH
jgi:formate dehydrogenase subunit gamma